MMSVLPHALFLTMWVAAMFGSQPAVGTKCSSSEEFHCLGQHSGCNNDGVCVCQSGHFGNPYLACFSEGHAMCSLVNDPRGRTFAGEPVIKGIDIPLPCRYLAASFKATNDVEPGDNPLEYSEVEVYTAEERFKGKYFVNGFEVILVYKLTGIAGRRGFSFRARATSLDGEYVTELETRQSAEGEYNTGNNMDVIRTDIGGTNIFAFDSSTKTVHLHLEYSGLDINFRPADLAGKGQKNQPGMVIASHEQGFSVRHLSLSESFCLTPDTSLTSVSSVGEIYQMDADMAFTYRAIAAGFTQDFPNTAQAECAAMSTKLEAACTDTTKRAKAMETCDFILSDSRFVSCYSGEDHFSTVRVLDLFTLCMEGYCTEDHEKCANAQRQVDDTACRKYANYLFVGFSCEYKPK